MDIPFHSSNAMSRAHYAIVRKVESAPSPQLADQGLFLEIKSIEGQLCHPKLSLKKCKECLVILLYCSTSVTPGFLTSDAFDFAFHHAINLAETGTNVEQKRIGYLFCAEMMPLDHDLRLMLINTLRKDLESDEVPRICLALNNLISSPTEDIIPAVQSRLHDLLSHDHSYVRRRALFAFRELSKYNPALIERIHGSILKRLQDSDSSVVQAALVIARTLPNDNDIVARVNDMLVAESAYISSTDEDIIFSILQTLRPLKLSPTNVPILFDILQEYSGHDKPTPHSKTIVLEIFLIFSQLDPVTFLSIEKLQKISAIQCVRHLLVSSRPDDVHLFMSCLECVPASSWAGTMPDTAAALDGLEFERIMQLLNFPDELLRTKTLRVIKRVDTSILDGHVEALINNAAADADAMDTCLLRIMEVRLVQHEEDGGEYARHVLDMLRKADEIIPSPRVFKGVIEVFLVDIRTPRTSGFVSSCATHVTTVLSEPEVHLGPTALIIATALATEFSGSVPTSPLEVLSGLAARIRVCPAIVQEPCIIAMLRIRAECEEVPSDAIDAITALSQTARRSIKSLCMEFLEFSQDKEKKEILLRIIRDAESPSLPDFLAALQRYKGTISKTSSPAPQISRASSRASQHGPSSLRYDAYAAPEAIPSLRTRTSGSRRGAFDSSTRKLSANNLSSPPAHVGHATAKLDGLHLSPVNSMSKGSREASQNSDMSSRADLISLGSPFEEDSRQLLETSETMEREYKFEDTWKELHTGCDLRGWSNAPIDAVTRKLQRVDGHHLRVISSDVPPFIGELKILVIPNEGTGRSSLVAFRLQEAEDDSCLWRLRCANDGVGGRMERMMGT